MLPRSTNRNGINNILPLLAEDKVHPSSVKHHNYAMTPIALRPCLPPASSLRYHESLHAQSIDARNSTFNAVVGDQYNYTTIEIARQYCLAPAVSNYNRIVSLIQRAQMSGAQLNVLAGCAYHLLQTLDAQYQHGNLVESETSASLEELNRYVFLAVMVVVASLCLMSSSLLHQIFIFVQRHANYDFVKLLCTKDQVQRQIKAYHSRIGVLVNAFQVRF
jgi:hypothetical protein